MKNISNLLDQREKELDELIKLYKTELPRQGYNQIEILEKIEENKYRIAEIGIIRRRVKYFWK